MIGKPINAKPFPNCPLRILLTPQQRKKLDRAARKAGKPTSTWARDKLLEWVDNPVADPPSG